MKDNKTFVFCKNCKNIYGCEHTYLEGCTHGEAFVENNIKEALSKKQCKKFFSFRRKKGE